MANGPLRSVAVFCGSSAGFDERYAAGARELGAVLAERGVRLVYGGGHVGLMGIVADAVLAGGGEVLGVIPEALEAKELAHRSLTELVVVRSMHERKALMADRADGFVALPGGFGTFDELFEILTWSQLGYHAKPVALFDVGGFFAPLVSMVQAAVDAGFIRAEHAALARRATSAAEVIALLEAPAPPPVQKWITAADR